MADLLPVDVPDDFTRGKNRDHRGQLCPIPDGLRFTYGTAGFRQNADLLPFVVFRMGYLAGLRARELNQTIGLMITASHNPACDNGVKIVDPKGEMLASDWEKYASELVNASDEQLPTAVRALEVQVSTKRPAPDALVVCAMDSRESGPHLMKAAKAGAALMDVPFESHGLLTTPQLHYIVRCKNDPSFGEPREIGYYVRISDAFKELLKVQGNHKHSHYSSELFLDCANGVGAEKMRMMCRFLPEDALMIQFRNEDELLNYECGADYVKISQNLPAYFDDVDVNAKCASFDGDADRLIYFRAAGDRDKVVLMDGDKIAVLMARYIKEARTINKGDSAGITDLTLGVVQTAYANGSSTKYLREAVGVTPVFVPTGVKHLHHAAIKFDVGIYFEANGHGTVVFSEKFHQTVEMETSNDAVKRLRLFSRVLNEVVGDAMADLLAVELLLRWYGFSIEDWERELYTDAPNVQLKIPVVDRSKFKTTYEETTLLEPEGVQEKIDALVAQYNGARAFVRPSGTENIVRVYAEAQVPEEATTLADSIATLIRQL
ncbi:phosphoglucomutase/phosphomannomutase, alpha/beta/alpha domain I [Necator americanus]|uniref:Phosphoacetylglucosamine mutase n=1 Tax=Necator americanus TaxID=51031 RepID=W2TXT3_NECAM|nr:phosphoglucomutase/phosphomannomutase, alpha/beta/alpha domain I [Necator americanus]ETN86678.1 phosphoglucomutase/phosphomannomutase, alpha/beta/alpha domain I [Necator americanus]